MAACLINTYNFSNPSPISAIVENRWHDAVKEDQKFCLWDVIYKTKNSPQIRSVCEHVLKTKAPVQVIKSQTVIDIMS